MSLYYLSRSTVSQESHNRDTISKAAQMPESGDEMSSRDPATFHHKVCTPCCQGWKLAGLDYVRPFVQIFIIQWQGSKQQERKVPIHRVSRCHDYDAKIK